MKIRTALYLGLMSFILCTFAAQPVFPEDKNLEKSKTQILEDIETLRAGLFKTKECVVEAKTEAELERCREATKIRRFEEVQDKLFEMGMSREERRMKKSPREY
ncbi:hypothetical protein JZK55_20890 [Dissulfurispira thermophila]|uniref:Uncharacterized protein n=1 Tax=Dissulfurispira thermophila TaxID=2715679 RepID=A0A7G1H5Z2_9BACT|nr:hypothetical protein [Dissulfurispira thermophila]BCB97167.1 hypothetical protein JZK55_20890 [Dissulfurispira thermophila]